MHIRRTGIILSVLMTILLVMSGCQAALPVISGTGTISFVEIAGGFYGIVGEDGTQYEPIGLPGNFEVDGLRVTFTGRLRDDYASIFMWGRIIEVESIEPVPDATAWRPGS